MKKKEYTQNKQAEKKGSKEQRTEEKIENINKHNKINHIIALNLTGFNMPI